MLRTALAAFRLVSSATKNSVSKFSKLDYIMGSAFQARFSSTDKVSVQDADSKIATVIMQSPPVNGMNLEFLQEMTTTIKNLEANGKCRAFILTSGNPKIFSGGLDIFEMYQVKPERFTQFWTAFQEFWIALYSTPLITLAAVNGHAPAGGCLMAVSCDYRIMVDGPISIGLNETLLGLAAPIWFQDVFTKTVGHRQAEKALYLGKLFSPKEALSIGLVDEVVKDNKELIQQANTQLAQWLNIPEYSRRLTKKLITQPLVDKLRSFQERETKEILHIASSEQTQKLLGKYLEMLKKK